ncbi:MAG: HNH endonuclease, partial [Candidatus Angelobacter sp.]
KKAFLEWLTGSLPGVYIPKALNLKEFALLALSVLGITWANIRQKLVKATSENIVKGLEVGFAIVKKLVTEGPAAAWEEIKSQLTNLKDMVMEGIMNFIIETVVKKAVAKVLSLLVPGGAFIQAIISIYDTVMVFIAKLKKIIQVAMAFLDSMMAIANGQIGAAAAKVESVLAGLLTLAISFLAGFLGLGKIADKVMNIINTKVRAPVDKAIDFVINWIVTTAKNLFKALFGKKDAKPDERTPAQKQADLHKGVTEAQALLKAKDATPTGVRAKLPSIQATYKLTSLTLVQLGGEKYQIAAAVNPEETGDQVALGEDVGATIGQQVIAKVGDEWKLGAVDQIDQSTKIVWSKITGARIGFPFPAFKASFSGGYTIIRPFDPNAKGNGNYKHLPDPPSVGPFKYFSGTQKAAIIADNRSKHKGSLVSDQGGVLVLTTKRAKGAKVNPDEVNIDHIFPRSQGGWNSYGNAQVLSFSQNLAKLDQIPDVF